MKGREGMEERVQALFSEGVRLQEAGNVEKALECYGQIIAMKPEMPEVYFNMALIFAAKQEWLQGYYCYTRVAELQSGDLLARQGMAEMLFHQGRYDEAKAHCNEVLVERPQSSTAWRLLGEIAFKEGLLEKALEYYRNALGAEKNNTVFLNRFKDLENKCLSLRKTLARCEEVLRKNPGDGETWQVLGESLYQLGLHEEAVNAFCKALELGAGAEDIAVFCGQFLRRRQLFETSLSLSKKMLERWPENAWLEYESAESSVGMGNFKEAIHHYQRAAANKDLEESVWNRLSDLYARTADFAKAIEVTRCLMRARPEDHELEWFYATLLLRSGDLKKGFEVEQCRKRTPEYSRYDKLRTKCFWRKQSLQGRRIFVYTEQGFGDTLQYVRYLELLKKRGAIVYFSALSEMMELFEQLPVEKLILQHSEMILPEHDYAVSLLDLPYCFATCLDTIPSNVPYIRVDIPLQERGCELLAGKDGFKVGLVWAAGNQSPTAGIRSLRLAEFGRLAKYPELTFYSLQKGEAAREAEDASDGMKIVPLDGALNNFADTAGVVHHLDLVITVDTAVAHLAGAMGKEVWLLLSEYPDWRWLTKRNDSPWYPSMRIFRKEAGEDWGNLMEKVEFSLKEKTREWGTR